jgi:transposase
MTLKRFIGVDVSKNTMDFAVFTAKEKAVVLQLQCKNTPKDLAKLKRELTSHRVPLNKSTVVICENTGMYMRHLVNFAGKQNCTMCVESALQIKRSLGIQRGKNDKIDSCRIAEYGLRNVDKLKPWRHPRDIVFRLRDLLNLREKIMRLTHAITTPLNEKKPFYVKRELKLLTGLIDPAIEGLQSSMHRVMAEIKTTIRNDSMIRHQFKLLMSVPGVGEITALYLISFTNEFSTTTSARKLASYAGIAPFPYSSGTIVGKAHVHPTANKTLKNLLHLAALSSIKKGSEFRSYYERKQKEGKHKMSVINAVRNKIVKRVAAVINRGTPYLPKAKYDA